MCRAGFDFGLNDFTFHYSSSCWLAPVSPAAISQLSLCLEEKTLITQTSS